MQTPATSALRVSLELVMVGVSDVDRAKRFYAEVLGWGCDHDQRVSDDLRFVQVTPPGSACSIAFGQGITPLRPGDQKGLQAVVDDADAARADLLARGVECTEVDEMAWGRFVFFNDPDGNAWILQQVPARG
ncbi:VOC family protein [Quadrisphaera oryzae]|uniref:VOC family protein n=1 Tax=Quadrisphaera TaxID=317661 RepID=UPI00351C6A0C